VKQLGLFSKSKLLCDGSTIEWVPEYKTLEREICTCQREDCENCDTEDYTCDAAEPKFHGEHYPRNPDSPYKIHCKRCGEGWEDTAGLFMRIYSRNFFTPFEQTHNSFFSTLEKK
jgi:hypothetical protein